MRRRPFLFGVRLDGDEWLGALDALAALGSVPCLPKFEAALSVEPEFSGIAEDAGEDQGCIRGNGAAIVAKLIDVLAREARDLGQAGLRDAEWGHELLDEDFTNGDGFSFRRPHKTYL